MININFINIIIISFVTYFAFWGFKRGVIKELSTTISYMVGFLISKYISTFVEIYLSLEIFIKTEHLRQKFAYLLSFILVIYLFKIMGSLLEKLINVDWQSKFLGALLGGINGVLIFSIIIFIFKELSPSISAHDNWKEKSIIYKRIDDFQKQYLIQYKKSN